MANGATGILTAGTQGITTPEEARRAWPQWLALGVGMIAVALVSVFWDAAGARLLLGALGLFLVVRGAVLLRGARSGAVGDRPGRPRPRPRHRRAGRRCRRARRRRLLRGPGGPGAAGRRPVVLLVPASLSSAAAGPPGAAGRRCSSGPSWSPACSSPPGVAQGWARAADVATVVAALAVAVLGVPLIVGVDGLRRVAAEPAPAPRARRRARAAPAAPAAAGRS